MSLTDLMSGARLELYAEIGLVVSVVAFTAIVIWALLRPRREMERRARQVLDGDEPDRED